MLRSTLMYASASLAILLGAYVAGCSDTTGSSNPVDQAGKQPPPPPENGVAGDGDGMVYAINELFLGDTDRSGSVSSSAWKEYGYNLDGRVSTKKSSDLCQPNSGAPPSSVYPDGHDGIDNAFGKLLLPIIKGLAADASTTLNENIQEGEFTIMVRIDSLGSAANYLDLPAMLYAGGELGSAPKFDGTDEWPVLQELLEDPTDLDTSKVSFPVSYTNENTWVSGTPATVDLALSVAGFSLVLSIGEAVITMDLDADHGAASGGVIAGILAVEPLIDELRKVAGSFSADLCSGSTFDSVADQIRQAADILSDGTQDPSQTCSGISIGLGFSAKPVKLGEILGPAEPAPDPCDEGTGGAGGGTGGSGAAGGSGGSGAAGGSGGTGGSGGG